MSGADLTEAVEAAARVFSASVTRFGWDALPEATRSNMREAMRPLTEAALPFIEAAVREQVAAEIRAVAADPERTRPVRKDAEVATDYANDFEWAAMVAENGAPA